jgi:sentrin-specific protease 1
MTTKKTKRADNEVDTRAHALTPEERRFVNTLWNGPQQQLHRRVENISLGPADFALLRPHQWFNDELINAYFYMLAHPRQPAIQLDLTMDIKSVVPKVYAFNSFFFPRLQRDGYEKVASWTRGVDLFDHDLVLIPVHVLCDHWCLVVINVQRMRIDYYDSLYSAEHCIDLDLLKHYLCREYVDKKAPLRTANGKQQQEMEECQWLTYEPRNTAPQQRNGSDCGVFVCQLARAFAQGRSFRSVKASDMLYYRDKMLCELMSY